jgi:hypothetical protein
MSVFLAFLSKLIAVYGCALTVNVLISGALQSRLAECGVDFSALSAAGVNITPSLTTFLSRINGKKGDFAYNVVFDPASYHTDASSLHMERMLCRGRALNLFIAGSAGNVRTKCGYIGKACAHIIELSAEDEPMRAEYCGKACTRTAFTLYGAEELWQNTYLSLLTPGSSPCPWVDKYKELSM